LFNTIFIVNKFEINKLKLTNHEKHTFSIYFTTDFCVFTNENDFGVVNDENNMPLIGVNITVQNSNIGALTDFDGNYSITIPSGKPKVLIFSYLGIFITGS